jgi:hypothetical protein
MFSYWLIYSLHAGEERWRTNQVRAIAGDILLLADLNPLHTGEERWRTNQVRAIAGDVLLLADLNPLHAGEERWPPNQIGVEDRARPLVGPGK